MAMNSFTPTKPFRFWCQKVLPLVYDDSLSYYELLCKVVDYLNNVINDVNLLGQNVDELNAAFKQLKDYVDNYFDNLDVQEEINNKLDAMIADGTFDRIISTYVMGNLQEASVADQTDIANVNQDSANVGSWTNYYMNNVRTHVNNKMVRAADEYQYFGIESKNGWMIPELSAIPFRNCGDALGILAVMGTYLNKNITYGRINGMFNTELATYAEQMVCSDYVFAGLLGIIYDGSKFVGYDNTVTDYCAEMFKTFNSRTAPVAKNALITREMAMIFAASGSLYRVSSQFMYNVMPGDVIFMGDVTSGSETYNYYLGINHCGIVVNVDHEGGYLHVLECGTLARLFRYSYINQGSTQFNGVGYDELTITTGNLANYPIFVARPSYNYLRPRKVYSNTGSFSVAMSTTDVSAVIGEYKLKQGDLVEFKVHGNFNEKPFVNSGDYLRWYINQPSPAIGVGGKHMYRHYTSDTRVEYNIPRTYNVFGYCLDDTGDYSSNITFSGTSQQPFTLNADYELNVYRI